MQARACSEVDSLTELRSIVRTSCEIETFSPKPSQVSAWHEARARFGRIIEGFEDELELTDKLNTKLDQSRAQIASGQYRTRRP
jgi:hypothetical protein